MADPRNKFLKDAYWEEVRAMQARLHPPKPPTPAHSCGCGATQDLVAVHPASRWEPVRIYCPACLPADPKV